MSKGKFPDLFQPIQVGPLRLKNRIVMPPMSTNFADPRYPGYVSKKHKSYYVERAKGGAGLIIIERVNISPSICMRSLGLNLSEDRFISGFEELTQLIQKYGARCGVQLGHDGRIGGMSTDSDGNPDKSPSIKGNYFAASPLPHPLTGIIAQEFSRQQLEEVTEYFADAAGRAKKAGFDVVELHGAHGYLLNEFLSPYTNKRTDIYGGDIDGRARFPLQVVRRVKQRLGDRIVLSYRISAVEFVQGGLEIDESIYFAKRLEEAGVQIIHVSAGINETLSSMNRAIPPMSFPRGRLVPYAAQIKREVGIPVLVVQRINTAELADDIIREGKADLVSTGRALIADPHWPLKAQAGRLNEIRRCVACNQGCMERIILGNSLTCLHNPEVGRENGYGFKEKAKKHKKILVVGGGLAGMEAAYVLATKGHDVRLIEKEHQLGGSARIASVLPEKQEFASVVEFLENQLKRLSVDIKLGAGFDSHALKDENFDEIIIATGSNAIVPKLNLFTNTYKVRFAKEVFKYTEELGNDVFVLGGGSVGIEIAEYLNRYLCKNVTVIEMLDQICKDLGPLNRVDVLERIDKSSIKILLNTKVLELSDERVMISKGGKKEMLKPPDTVVIALGAKPNPLSLQGIKGRIHYIGDAKTVGNAMDAIHQAFNVAIRL